MPIANPLKNVLIYNRERDEVSNKESPLKDGTKFINVYAADRKLESKQVNGNEIIKQNQFIRKVEPKEASSKQMMASIVSFGL